MTQKKVVLYAVSDATGDLPVSVAVAAARQFKEVPSEIRRRPRIDSEEKVAQVVEEAQNDGALIVFTLVSPDLRQVLRDRCESQGVVALDIIGPVLDSIARTAEVAPSDQPGLKYQLTSDYFRRTEALAYTVKHDDGLGLDSLSEADIIILGISRTSKTPLSIYLAYRGYKVANLPIVKEVDVPRQVYKVDRSKLVGLSMDPEMLAGLRAARLKKLGRPLTEEYASIKYIRDELEFQKSLFSQLGNIPVINVTNKGIEESATDILSVLGQ